MAHVRVNGSDPDPYLIFCGGAFNDKYYLRPLKNLNYFL